MFVPPFYSVVYEMADWLIQYTTGQTDFGMLTPSQTMSVCHTYRKHFNLTSSLQLYLIFFQCISYHTL